MHHVIFEENTSYYTAILIKKSALHKKELQHHYVDHLNIPTNSIIGFSLEYNSKNKCPVVLQKEYLENLLKALDSLSITTLLVCDSNYFKTLTKSKTAEPHHGYILDCAIPGYEHMKVILSVNYQGLFYNPNLQEKITLSISTFNAHSTGTHQILGSSVIHSEYYPESLKEISDTLESLHQYPELVVDCETFDLMFNKAGIGTIAFAWDKHNGVAFCVDYLGLQNPNMSNKLVVYGKVNEDIHYSMMIRNELKKFFETYKGTLTYHNANFDIKILIYSLFMENVILNYEGLLKGLEILTRNIEDTKLIAYLATNSTAGNVLGLKQLAHEFAGNYAEDDIKNICLIEKSKLLRYNLVDCLSTWYVKEKYYPIMITDNQEDIYKNIMIPSIKNILQMELTGMPLNMEKVGEANRELTKIRQQQESIIFKTGIVKKFTKQLRYETYLKENILLKVKIRPIEDFNNITYNPASNPQTSKLLYNILKLPIIDLTDTKQPAVGAKTLKKLIHLTTDTNIIILLNALISLAEVSKIIDTFIKAMMAKSIEKFDGMHYLHGNFNLGGTVSARLSSSKPNLQNIPSTGTIYAKVIKKCFQAPPGYLFMGADFSSLEDKISALTTKDPNKLRVYTDGLDGHCLRAHTYFSDQMLDINPTSVKSINSIKHKYPALRQKSKEPTFLLTYQGTHHGLQANVGLSEEVAKSIEAQYHLLYEVSDKWVQDRLNQATIDGYVTVAFGLRVRTPILAQTYLNKKSTPYEAKAEGRTAGNAMGQSYGLLTNRAGIEFQQRCLTSKHALNIKPIAHIHDALYFLVKNDFGTVDWFNRNLIECMEWQKLPEIQHPTIKLGGEVDIFYPSWNESYTIPNRATKKQIKEIISK